MCVLNCTGYEIYSPDIVSSDGCFVIDENGKKYLDFESGNWCTSLGHNNKIINAAIIEQINRISHTGDRYTSKIVEEAAMLLLSVLQMEEGRCVFLSSGSEAVEFSVQIARNLNSKPLMLNLKNFYLSAFGLSSNRTSSEWYSIDISNINEESNYEEFLESIPFDEIGVFVFEPGNASGTVRLPDKKLISQIVLRIKANKGIIVVNEVTTGIGRTGK